MLFEGGGGEVSGEGKNTLSYLSSMEGLIPKRGWASTSCQVPQIGKVAEVTRVF